MRLTKLNEKVLGKILATPIYSQNGIVYLNKGMELNEKNIKSLINLGINTIYVEDGNDEIPFYDVLDISIKFKVLKLIEELFDEIKKSKKINEKKLDLIAKDLISGINTSENAFLCNNIVNNNPNTKLYTHSLNVTLLSLLIGLDRKYDSKKLYNLLVGALLHDIGKLVGDEKNHCKAGYEIAKNNHFIMTTSYMCILQHHENEDGTGPNNLKSDKIHEFGKIVNICNEYDNLINNNKVNIPSMAIETITAKTPIKFDMDIYKNFINSVYCYPNGINVKLNDGTFGQIVLQNKNFPTRPIVGVVKNGSPQFVNLLEHLTLSITEIEI